jgi:hypothetical protein
MLSDLLLLGSSRDDGFPPSSINVAWLTPNSLPSFLRSVFPVAYRHRICVT